MTPEAGLSWVSEVDLRELGFAPTAPEHDLGQRLGPRGTIRVSFAPCGEDDFGYLYAYDRSTDRYAVLASHCTLDQVLRAFAAASNGRPTPDGYTGVADLLANDHALSLTDTRKLWLHCAAAEAAIRHRYDHLPLDAPDRFTTAHAYLVARGARIAAEDIMRTSLRPEWCTHREPVIIAYRISGHPEWTGHVAAANLNEAAFRVADLTAITRRLGYHVEATSLTHGAIRVPATQIPELRAFAPSSTRAAGGMEF